MCMKCIGLGHYWYRSLIGDPLDTYLINSSQIFKILESLKNITSAGIDSINNRCLNALPNKRIKLLTIIVNSCPNISVISLKSFNRIKLSQLEDLVSKLIVHLHTVPSAKNIVTFLPFGKHLYMSSLIANQVKTNMCIVSVKLLIVLTTFVPLFTLN